MNNKQMSSYLQFRMIDPMGNHTIADNYSNRIPIYSSDELEIHLRKRVTEVCNNFSGGGSLSS